MASIFYITIVFLIISLLTVCAEGDIFVYSQEPPHIIMEKFRDMPARFGDNIDSEGLRAYVVASSPTDGCANIQPPPATNFTNKWVVLIARYNCSFETKIRNAQNAGYHGAIVHNVNSNDLQIMYAKNPDGIHIPSVFVGEDAGLIIELNYLYKDGYFVVINGELPYDLNHLLIPFAIVVSLSVIVLLTFMVVKCLRDRRRARRHRLSSSSLKKIPTCKFTKGDPYDTCAICLDDYVEGDKLRVLPCAHAYHYKCIDPWLTKNRRVCPVCKRKVFVSNERVTSRSTSVQNNRDSNSDSDSDESIRSPLIPNTSRNTTQGGTFQQPSREGSRVPDFRENVVEIWNEILRRNINASQNANSRNEESATDSNHSEVTDDGSENPSQSSTTVHGGPFLTGFLNLRGNTSINRNNDTDREPLLPSVASQRIVEVPESDESSDESSDFYSSQHTVVEDNESRESPDEKTNSVGRIGVAALPNRDSNNQNSSGHSSRDYVV